MLAALRRDVARAAALPARRAHEGRSVRALAEQAGLAVAAQARVARISASSPAPAASASSRATAACGERPGDIVDRGGRVLGRHRGHHGYTVGQRKGLGIAAPRAALRARDRRPREHRHRRQPRGARDEHRARARRCACTTARSPTPSSCATTRPRCAAAWTAIRSTSTSRSTARRPGRRRSSCAGTRSSDAPQSPRDETDEIRETFLRYFEAPRPPAPALGVACAVDPRTRRCC